MKYTLQFLCALSSLLIGCATPQNRTYPVTRDVPSNVDEEVDLIPPVPTFTSISNCEQAYGFGACGDGTEVYARARLEAPPEVRYIYMPFAYSAAPTVLIHRYYAPPTVYISTVQYNTFISPVVIQRYSMINTRTIEVYHRAPVHVREQALRSGPVVYVPSRAVVKPLSVGFSSTNTTPVTERVTPSKVAPPQGQSFTGGVIPTANQRPDQSRSQTPIQVQQQTQSYPKPNQNSPHRSEPIPRHNPSGLSEPRNVNTQGQAPGQIKPSVVQPSRSTSADQKSPPQKTNDKPCDKSKPKSDTNCASEKR